MMTKAPYIVSVVDCLEVRQKERSLGSTPCVDPTLVALEAAESGC